MTIPTGKFVWFDYVSKDPAKAQGFFGELFNWKTREVPMPQGAYTMIASGEKTIGGYMAPPEGAPAGSHWLPHLQVASAADTAVKITSLGGKIRMAPFKIGEFGTMAVVADKRDATFALWQPAKPEPSSKPATTRVSTCDSRGVSVS